MSPKLRIVHLVALRPVSDQRVVRWYVRYVWTDPKLTTRDRVVVSGEIEIGPLPARDIVREALIAALRELDAEAWAHGDHERL